MQLGWQEIFLIFVVAVALIGPQDLPKVIKVVGAVFRKIRGIMGELQSMVEEVIADDEISTLKREMEDIGSDISSDINSGVDFEGAESVQTKTIGRDFKRRVRGADGKGIAGKNADRTGAAGKNTKRKNKASEQKRATSDRASIKRAASKKAKGAVRGDKV